RGRHIAPEEVFAAIRNAKAGPVEEGSVGAGTGTVAFGWKGGIGTSSRRLPQKLGGYTVGVLVQTNFGGILTIAGAPVGRELGRYYLQDQIEGRSSSRGDRREAADGSIMIVVAGVSPPPPPHHPPPPPPAPPRGCTGHAGCWPDRLQRQQRQRRFCHCLFYGVRSPHSTRRRAATVEDVVGE